MKKFSVAVGLALIVGAPAITDAEPIPGQDAPEFTAAIELWLDHDEPMEVYPEIGRLAVAGNVAAQYFANHVSRYSEMTREEGLAIWPPVSNDDRLRRFRPYEIDTDAVPALAARRAISSATDEDAWFALIEIMLDGGLREGVVSNIASVLRARRPFDIEVAQYAAGLMSPADPEIFELWAFLYFELAREVYMPSEDRLARWDARPDELLRQTGYVTSLERGHWPALLVESLKSDLGLVELASRGIQDELVASTSRLMQARFEDQEADDADLISIGLQLQANRDQTPYFWPLMRFCEEHCAGTAPQCVASGAVFGTHYLYGVRSLEPIIEPEIYFASRRSTDEFLTTITSLMEHSTGGSAHLHQCMSNAIP